MLLKFTLAPIPPPPGMLALFPFQSNVLNYWYDYKNSSLWYVDDNKCALSTYLPDLTPIILDLLCPMLEIMCLGPLGANKIL